jgi:hypothetical protein
MNSEAWMSSRMGGVIIFVGSGRFGSHVPGERLNNCLTGAKA